MIIYSNKLTLTIWSDPKSRQHNKTQLLKEEIRTRNNDHKFLILRIDYPNLTKHYTRYEFWMNIILIKSFQLIIGVGLMIVVAVQNWIVH